MVLACSATSLAGQEAIEFGQPVTDPIIESNLMVDFEFVAELPPTSDELPRTRINELNVLGDGSDRMFINDLRGKLYEIVGDTPHLYMDYAELVPELYHANGLGSGLGSVAFHPDFHRNGKFYTTHVEALDESLLQEEVPERQLRWWTTGVLTEWTAEDPSADRFEGRRREMLRLLLPSSAHGLQQISFNPNAGKGDPDFGMLYFCVGESGSMYTGRSHNLRSLKSPLGCILRLDPLGKGSLIGDYGIPQDNPWANHEDPEVLGEIWSMGMRNPHRMSWDPGGTGRMLFVDIGEMRLEEVNLGEPGRDYGWPIREGTFRFDSSLRHLVFTLTDEDHKAVPDLTYPVAQYDHTNGYAISGGGVYRGDKVPELYGKYLFGDIVTGRLFFVEESDLEFGRLSPVYEFHMSLDGSPTSMARLLDGGRVDLRFGWDAQGELYLFEKARGRIYKAVGSNALAGEGRFTTESIDRQLIEHEETVDPKLAVVASGDTPVVSSLENGEVNKPGNGDGGYWFSLGTPTDEKPPIRVIEQRDAPGAGTRVLEAKGQDIEEIGPRILFSLASGPRHFDASGYKGFQFWVKGNLGRRMRIVVNTAYTAPVSRGGLCTGEAYECNNIYHSRFDLSPDWKLVRVPFARFEQDGFPNDGPLDPGILKEVGFSIRPGSAFEFWVDDFGFYKD